MSNEAAEELAQLSTIYARLGQNENAEKARIEARSINPALEEIPAESLVPEDEIDLTPESPEPCDDLAMDVEVSAAATAEQNVEPDVAISMDEDDLPLAVEPAEPAEPADEEQPSASVSASSDDVEVVIDEAPDEFSVEVEMDSFAGEIGTASEEDEVEESAPVTDKLNIPGDEISVGGESSPDAEDVEIDLDGIAGEESEDDDQVEFDEGPAEIPEPSVASEVDSPVEDVEDVEDEEDRTRPPGQPSAPTVAPTPEPVPAASAARDDLAEVDEYMALGLYEDARDTLREILKKRPEGPAGSCKDRRGRLFGCSAARASGGIGDRIRRGFLGRGVTRCCNEYSGACRWRSRTAGTDWPGHKRPRCSRHP